MLTSNLAKAMCNVGLLDRDGGTGRRYTQPGKRVTRMFDLPSKSFPILRALSETPVDNATWLGAVTKSTSPVTRCFDLRDRDRATDKDLVTARFLIEILFSHHVIDARSYRLLMHSLDTPLQTALLGSSLYANVSQSRISARRDRSEPWILYLRC